MNGKNMIYIIEGRQYSIPADKVRKTDSIGMVKTTNGVIADTDIARADEEAAGFSRPDDTIEIQRLRLYFELIPGGSVTQTPPLGVASAGIGCHWRFFYLCKSDLDDPK